MPLRVVRSAGRCSPGRGGHVGAPTLTPDVDCSFRHADGGVAVDPVRVNDRIASLPLSTFTW